MKTTVFFTLQFEGFHCWAKCPIEEVSFLRDRHRHMFHVRGEKQVFHDDRDVEFIMLKNEVAAYLAQLYPKGEMGSTSCEMVAEHLLEVFDLVSCEVSEDGENGAVAYANSLQEIAKDTYTDPSSNVRKCWTGIEVEGRLRGVATLFANTLSALPAPSSIVEPHVFLCPDIAQGESNALDEWVKALVDRGKVVTIAARPADLNKIPPYSRVRAHIMVDIDLHGASWLKPTDTIKVETDFYTTHSVAVRDTIHTKPEDYANDTEK